MREVRDRSVSGRWGGRKGGMGRRGSRTPPRRGEVCQEVTEHGEVTGTAEEEEEEERERGQGWRYPKLGNLIQLLI